MLPIFDPRRHRHIVFLRPLLLMGKPFQFSIQFPRLALLFPLVQIYPLLNPLGNHLGLRFGLSRTLCPTGPLLPDARPIMISAIFVFPLPRWPIKHTFRITAGSTATKPSFPRPNLPPRSPAGKTAMSTANCWG